MEMSAEQNNRKYIYWILCILAGAAALLPVSCEYIMTGGIVKEWISRIQELAAEGFVLFPTRDVLAETGNELHFMNSNLWFFLPGVLYRITGKMVLAYRVYMLLVQLAALFSSVLFFRRIFIGEENGVASCFGVILYMTCPYRIFVCYDLADLSLALVWSLMPLYAWAAIGLVKGNKDWKNLAAAAFVLAGAGYADLIHFLCLAGITLLGAVFARRLLPLLAVAAGGVLFFPGVYRLVQYLFFGRSWGMELPLQKIMQNGYRLGEFFYSYAFRDNRPGMGIGMLICLLAGIWLRFVMREEKTGRQTDFFMGTGIFLLVVSDHYFPWDVVQRLGSSVLKLVSLIGTPSIFGGLAYGCLCVPAASSVARISRHDNKILAFVLPLAVLLACIGLCIYQCNMLTFSRAPMDIL